MTMDVHSATMTVMRARSTWVTVTTSMKTARIEEAENMALASICSSSLPNSVIRCLSGL